MVGPALKKYAKAHGLKSDGGFVYGALHGYSVAMDDGPNIKRMFLITRFPDDAQKAAFDATLGGDVVTRYRIQTREYRDNQLAFVFTDKIGTMKLIEEFIDWLLPQLAQFGMATDLCSHCGGPSAGSGKWVVIDGLPYHMHESCLNSRIEIIRGSEERAREEMTGSYLNGFIGALLGGLLGSLIWAGVMYIGFIAGLAGFLIGFFAEKGYRLLKGKEGKGKLLILIGVVLLCVVVGTLLGEYFVCAKVMRDNGVTGISTLDSLRILVKTDADVRAEIIRNLLIGLLLAGLGVLGILIRTRRETSGANIKVLK